MPYVSQVAIGRRPFVSVYGADYDTPDGTGWYFVIIDQKFFSSFNTLIAIDEEFLNLL